VIAASVEAEWQALCRVLDHPEWTKEERFSTPEKRKENGEALDQLLGQWTIHHTAEEVVHLLQQAGVPAGVVQDAEDLTKDPQLMAREFFIHLEHPVLGHTTSDRSPIRMSQSSTECWKAAPLLGEDNRYVYMELLGMEEQAFSSYVERGIIA
jgi:crotonobetainyl-CoA:carnitine CoA-transferase CaiB-like acyl-CoA transferase